MSASDSYHAEQADRILRRRQEILHRQWRREVAWRTLLAGAALFVLGLLLSLAGCAGLSPETTEALQKGWAANANDASNEALSAKERAKGAHNARLLRRVADETNTPLPDADEGERR